MSIFDERAAQWDDKPRRIKLAQDVCSAIREKVLFTANTSLLDIGTGTGLILLSFSGVAGRLTGADSSSGMLAALSEKAEKAEISIETLVFDINRDNFEQDNYDVVTCGMMLHHLENPSVLFEKAYGALKKGGCICVSDLLEEDGSFHDDAKGVHHSGFAADYISYLMKNTGFRDVSVETASVVKKQREHGEDSYPVFLAVGRK